MIERYTLPEMGGLWSEENKFRTWLKVEVEAARAMAKAGIISTKSFKVIERKADFNVLVNTINKTQILCING